MTKASFVTEGSRIQAFTIEGHSGWADSGEDILCAAITRADQVCQTLLAALMVYFVQLQEEYPQHIYVMEV